MGIFCNHNQYKADTRLKALGTAAYFSLIGIYFYFSKRSETVVTRTGSIFGVGSVTAGWLEIFVFILVGIFVFALLPGKKTCQECGESWRF